MERILSHEDFVEIIWSELKNAAKDENHPWFFNRLKEHFNRAGESYNSDSDKIICEIFDRLSDVYRDEMFKDKSKRSDTQLIEFCNKFLTNSFLKIAKVYELPENVGKADFDKNFAMQINSWFKTMNDEDSGKSGLFSFNDAEQYLRFLNDPSKRLGKLNALDSSEKLSQISNANGDLGWGYGPIGNFVIATTMPWTDCFEDGITPDQVICSLMLISNLPEISDMLDKVVQARAKLNEAKDDIKLSRFFKNKVFIDNCKALISGLSPSDRYHGTNSSTIPTIMKNGLLMVQDDINSTSYAMRGFRAFANSDELLRSLLLFKSGFDDARGDGMVFFNGDAKPINIASGDKKIGLNYSMNGFVQNPICKVNHDQIIGAIDTVNMKVYFGPAFERGNKME